MSKQFLSLVVFFVALLTAAVYQWPESESPDLALALDIALPLSLVPVLAIFLGARALGFIGGLLLCLLVLTERLAPVLAGVMAVGVIVYGLCWLSLPAWRRRVRAYLELIGLSDPTPPSLP